MLKYFLYLKEHCAAMIIEAEFLAHHTERLTRETTCQQFEVKLVITAHIIIESNYVSHLNLIGTIVIGLIGLSRIGINL